MRKVNGLTVLSATDLTKHTACAHTTTLDLAYLSGDTGLVPAAADEALALIADKGDAHEKAILADLAGGGTTVAIPTGISDLAASNATLTAMRDGADVIYQACLAGGRWSGRADFLIKSDRPSDLGPWSYDIADSKLARTLRVPALVQMAVYAEGLTALQGVAPRQLIVITGDRAAHPWRTVDVASYAARLRRSLEKAVDERPATESAPTSYCVQCRWSAHCTQEWIERDDLSQVAGLRRDQRQSLIDHGITTLRQLADATDDEVRGALTRVTRPRLRQQARLQVAERESGTPGYEILSPEPHRGLNALPEPNPGDVYIDFEGDPWAEGGQGREYLVGIWDRAGTFTDYWAHDRAAEKKLTEDLIDDLTGRLARHPGMHVYHYAPYEVTALKRLTSTYATREIELDQLLRREVFVDLYAVVRAGLRISKPSYSIKKLEAFYWSDSRSESGAEVADAGSSIVEYERWLENGDQDILDAIREYNRDDVRSTHDLHGWLENRRAEAIATGAALTRPHREAEEPPKPDELAELELAEQLVDAGHELLAGLVGWHRREARPQWWDFFRLGDLQTDELIEDRAAIGAPEGPELVGDVLSPTGRATSKAWRYTFPPQECAFRAGDGVRDVDTNDPVGTVLEIDAEVGTIVLKLGAKKLPGNARGFGALAPINDGVLRESIQATAAIALDGGDNLALRLLSGIVPSADLLAALSGEDNAHRLARIGQALDGEVLAVQGPPGTGKTYCGGELIRQLVAAGKKVGVVAQSHEVIRNLLRTADIAALQKVSADTTTAPAPHVTEATENAAVLDALGAGEVSLVGGTAWLWARPEMIDSVDVLVIDEAGQFSLANAAAVAPAARSLVLLGDPQQLRQPTQAQHPYGAGISALEHIIGEHDTIPDDRGAFLETTWRMHPRITAFISELAYNDRLHSVAGRERVQISASKIDAPGLYWLPVRHELRSARSPEEAAAVASLVEHLLAGTWDDGSGTQRPITERDILVVAPFNAHVAELRKALPAGVKVGTVDKFQGQQAAVVIYSMASSSADDAPRGIDFLYDVHRLNVAISRAIAAAIIVASPTLLDAAVQTPEQLRSVNALCRYVELAREVGRVTVDE